MSTPRPRDHLDSFLAEIGLSQPDSAIEDAAEALPAAAAEVAAGRARLKTARARVKDLPPLERQKANAELKTLKRKRGSLAKDAREISSAANERGVKVPGKLMSVGRELAEDRIEADKGILRKGLDHVVQGGSTFLSALDAPAKAVRWATSDLDWDRASPEEWVRYMRERSGPVGRAAVGVSDAAMAGPGAALGGAVALAGAAVDVATGHKPEWENAKQTIADTMKSSSDFALTMAADPLSYVSGGSSQSKNASAAVRRLAKSAGLNAAETANVAARVAEIVAQRGPKDAVRSTWARAAHAMESAGIPAEDFISAFGKQGEHLGAGQLRVEIPLTKKGVEIIPAATKALTGKSVEHIGRKVAAATYEPVRKTLGAIRQQPTRGLFDPAPAAVKARVRAGRGDAAATRAAMLQELEGIATQANQAGISQARREAITEGVFDPRSRRTMLANLSPAEQQYVAQVEGHFRKWGKELERVGALKPGQLAANPASGKYFPRFKDALLSLPEETPLFPSSAPGVPRQAIQHSRKGEKTLQQLGDEYRRTSTILKPFAERPVTDALEAGPVYAKQASQAKAQAEMTSWLAENYGKPLKGPRAGWTELPEMPGIHVPTDLHNMVAGTFHDAVESTLRAMGRGDGRANALAKTYRLMGRLKTGWARNRLAKTPAYYAKNFTGDSLNMIGHGENPARVLLDGERLVRGKPVSIQTPAGTYTRDQIMAMARENIPASIFDRLELGRGAVVEGKRLQRIAAKGREGPVKEAWKKVAESPPVKVWNEGGEHVGRWWDARSRIGLFAQRLRKGDSPAAAGKFVADVLIDYGDRPAWMQWVNTVAPFSQYALKAPASVAKSVVRNPKGVLGVERAARFATSQEGNEPRTYKVHQGSFGYLTPRQKQLSNRVYERLGLDPIPDGQDALIPFGAPGPEAFSFIEKGPAQAVIEQMGPWVTAPMELIPAAIRDEQPRNLTTGQPIDYGPLGAAGRYLAPALLSDPAIAGINALTGNQGLLGNMPPPGFSDEEATAKNFVSLMTRFAPRPAGPSDFAWNILHGPAVRQQEQTSARMKRELKSKETQRLREKQREKQRQK